MNALDVYLHDARAGVLQRLEGARLRFTYEREWLSTAETPISLSLPELEGFVANEAYCMALAREVGLTVAVATPVRAGHLEALFVERYDRLRDGSEVRRIHQEDFCQASGHPPEMKYEAEGGPGVADCARLIREHGASPGFTVLQFLDALLFNFLIGNADAHSKNYSLLLEGDGAPRLAPLYDLISTRAHGRRFGRKMGMKYGGEYRPEWLRGRHLDRLGNDLGVTHRGVRRRADGVATAALRAREAARGRLPSPWFGDPVIATIDEIVAEFAGVLRKAAGEPS